MTTQQTAMEAAWQHLTAAGYRPERDSDGDLTYILEGATVMFDSMQGGEWIRLAMYQGIEPGAFGECDSDEVCSACLAIGNVISANRAGLKAICLTEAVGSTTSEWSGITICIFFDFLLAGSDGQVEGNINYFNQNVAAGISEYLSELQDWDFEG